MTPNHKSLSLYFVLSQDYRSEEDTSPDMKEAFKAANNWGIEPQWIKELDCLQTDSQTKGQVFVFESFTGDIFTRFTKSHVNSRVIGPKCLLSCFSKNMPIPPTKFPIYNMAMGGLIICASNVPVAQKKEMKELVGYMGGNFFDPLITSTTHLVVNSILSEKYFKACEVGVQVMKKSWIEDVWKRNFVSDVTAIDENIIHEYKIPIFYNLKVTASGLSEREKRKIEQIIRDNGGTYTQEMPRGTDILILPTGKGEKFKYAERWKMKCLHPSWIECCLKKGYAVRYQDYIVHSVQKKCSTPVNTCSKMVSLMNANDSDISVISSGSTKSVVCDTQVQSISTIRNNTFKTPVKCIPKNEGSPKLDDSTNYQTVLNDIVLSDVKKCGPLLDGCKMYLAGFKDNEEEKIRRILNYGGAIRFTELNESVTHVIVGNPNKHDLNNIKMAHHTPHVVTLDWLLSSIKKGCLEEESNCAYFVKKDEPRTSKVLQQPSPLSKKGLQMLKPTCQIPANSEPATEIDHNLIEKYSHSSNLVPLAPELGAEESNHSDRGELTKDQSMPNLTNDKLFAGLKFAIIGHEPNERDYLKRTILDLGGSISEEHRRIDYAILPVTNIFQDFSFTEVISSVWIEECIRESKIIEIKYYHRPLTIPEPLINKLSSSYVITFSSYSIQERQYLETVAEFLGARCQDVLSRKVDKDRNIAQTSHLVSALAQGAKYNAAKKWNLPIVTEKWLLDSFNQRKFLPLHSYLLQESGDNQSEEKKMSSRNDESSTAKSSEKKMTLNALRLYAIPTLAEAVENKSDNVCIDQNNRRKTEMKDFPLGLLAQINRASSSTIKRKVDDDTSNFEAARIGSPRRKLLRPDVGNVTSSYEEVGWQDTLTDIQLEAFPSCSEKKNSMDAKAISENDAKELPKDNILSGNNMKNGNADLPRHDDSQKNQKLTSNNLKNCEVKVIGVNENNREGENEFKKSLFQINSRERIVQPSRIDSKKTYWNMMISVNEKEKKLQCETIINELGGKVITRFDPDCSESERATHLIIDDLKKTEKLLCSISSGLWVLHSSYLLQCKKIGKFVDEKHFEWGNSLSKNLPVKESNDYLWIAKAAHRWRKRIQDGGPCQRPFVGMKAVIISSGKDEAMQSLIRVVKSGGGCLLQSKEILKATHCLVTSVKNLDDLPVSMNDLAAKKIHCLPAVYLSDYLMTDPPPEPESCYFDAYKRLL